MFAHPQYMLPRLFVSLNVEQTFAITTVWTRKPARYPAAATWSVCVLPGLRETSARWTSVCDATELPASLMRRQATWFASERFLSAWYFSLFLKSSSFKEKQTWIFLSKVPDAALTVGKLIMYSMWNKLVTHPITNHFYWKCWWIKTQVNTPCIAFMDFAYVWQNCHRVIFASCKSIVFCLSLASIISSPSSCTNGRIAPSCQLCDGYCYNGGTCHLDPDTNLPFCQ